MYIYIMCVWVCVGVFVCESVPVLFKFTIPFCLGAACIYPKIE